MIRLVVIFSVCSLMDAARVRRQKVQSETSGLDPEDCNPHTSCEACAAETSWWGSCRWCGAVWNMDRDKYGKCLGYSEFKKFDSAICDEDSSIYDEPEKCSVCRNIIGGAFGAPRFWDQHNNPPATCSDRASQNNPPRNGREDNQCANAQTKTKCSKACGIYSRRGEDPYICPEPSSTVRSFVQMVRDANPQVYDVIFVTEADPDNWIKGFKHGVIRMTEGRGGVYSHAIVISQVYPKLMVLEAVSSVEEGEPSGIREVAIEYAFLYVTKFELMRKRTECGLDYPDGHAKHPNLVTGIEWARKRTNIVKNGRGLENTRNVAAWAKHYSTFDSFLSVMWTPDEEKGYNDVPSNEPKGMYCSQVVAYVLYKQGCAFHSGSNLNVDPWEMYKQLGWQFNYDVVLFSDTDAHENAKQYTIEAFRPWMADDQFKAKVCEQANDQRDCEAVEVTPCTWWSEVCVPQENLRASTRNIGREMPESWLSGV